MRILVPVEFHSMLVAAAALALAGCASVAAGPAAPRGPAAVAQVAPAASESASAPAGAASGAARLAAPAAGSPPPFETVIKDAKKTDGLLALWRKDDKIWLEIPQDLFDKPLLFSVNISHSLGERGLVGSTMGPSWLASFVKVGTNQIHLLALNADHVTAGAPQQVTLAQNFSRSLLASLAAASAPHPVSKAVLVDAAFLLADIPSYSRALEAAFRLSYAPDRGNSHFRQAYASAEQTTIGTNMHFSVARLPVPPATPSLAPAPTPPSTVPDARSVFIGYVYSFARLAEQPMPTRKADGRIGHFVDTVVDFGSDRNVSQRVHYVNRWRLEKKDPQATLSEPVKPITFWLDRNIPLQYRATVMAGVLEWNNAFEKIGFRNAVVALQQPDDADWDTLDSTHASVRWYYTVDAGASASGPSHSDPRTGEILDADIKIGDGWARVLRRDAVEQLGAAQGEARTSAPGASWPGDARSRQAFCGYADEALSEVHFALDALYALGELAPDSPEAEAFVQGKLKEVVMHEVGHTLGLRHNFKASTVYSQVQLRDPAFTQAHGLTNSVMDYPATNLPLPGEPRSELFGRTIGPYDEWAIEYAYRVLEPKTEAEDLERIAARSTEPVLAFADDADAGGFGGVDGFDPLANRFDLGSDPLAYFERRLQLTRELWRRAQVWSPRPGEGTLRQLSMLASGFTQLQRAADLVGKYVGGLHAVREVPGTPGATGRRASFVPVDPAQQRRALDFLAKGLFSADSFRFAPQFVANLAPDYVESAGRAPVSIPSAVLRVQAAALDRLMSPGTAARLLDLPLFQHGANQRSLISLSEVYATLQGNIWSELKSGAEIDSSRRNLQREHLRRVQSALVRSTTPLPPDAMGLLRLHALRLQADLRRAVARSRLSVETQAHLQDSLAGLTEALRASMLRS